MKPADEALKPQPRSARTLLRRRRPTEVMLEDGQLLQLRGIAHGDLVFLYELLEEKPDADQFARAVLSHLVVPSASTASDPMTLPREELETITRQLALSPDSGIALPADKSDKALEGLLRWAEGHVATQVEEIQGRLRDILSQFTTEQSQLRMFQDVEKVRRSMEDLAETVRAGIQQFHSVQDALVVPLKDLSKPGGWLDELVRIVERARGGKRVLQQAGYGEAADLWSIAALLALVDLDPSHLNDAIPAHAREVVDDDDFPEELQAGLSATPELLYRWPAVREVLLSHQDERFHASIATALSQIEGLITDLVVGAGKHTYRDDGYLWPIDPSEGSKKKVNGWQEKLKLAPLNDGLLSVLDEKIRKDRNNILHGSRLASSDPGISAHLLVLILILAKSIARQAERGAGDTGTSGIS